MLEFRTLPVAALVSILSLAPMASHAQAPVEAAAPATSSANTANYLIAPGDNLQIFVWKNPDLSADLPVRPDGRITTPLVQDVMAQGKTPTQLAADLGRELSKYIQDPVVTVVVKGFAAPTNSAAIRVIGAAAAPKTVPYRSGLTVLDVLIEVGGLNTFADGNGAKLLRMDHGAYRALPLRLNDLIKAGKLQANVDLMPGDIIRIPERWF
jgi:polysaccharide export outer membrane protein